MLEPRLIEPCLTKGFLGMSMLLPRCLWLWAAAACVGLSACLTELPAVARGPTAPQALAAAPTPALPPYRPRPGRARPLVVVVAENYYTELVDYVLPYGIVAASQAADVMALATRDEPIRMFPAPMRVQPQATTAAFDAQHPDGADYVIVPAVHRDDDPVLLDWVRAQAAKGATVVGVCDGVWVLARAGLLEGRAATGHWYSFDKLRDQFPHTRWQHGRRYVADGPVVTTTGVSASIPVSLAIVQAIAGPERAQALADQLGERPGWQSGTHRSEDFQLRMRHRLTIAGNFLAFWSHEDLGLPLAPGIDEIALALRAEVYSATFRSTVYTVAATSGPVRSERGLLIWPDRAEASGLRMLPAPGTQAPLRTIDQALTGVAADYGARTAEWVRMQMEYPSAAP